MRFETSRGRPERSPSSWPYPGTKVVPLGWDLLIVDALPLKRVHLTRQLTLTPYFGAPLAFIR